MGQAPNHARSPLFTLVTASAEQERHDFGPTFLAASQLPILPMKGQIHRFSGSRINSFVQSRYVPGLGKLMRNGSPRPRAPYMKSPFSSCT